MFVKLYSISLLTHAKMSYYDFLWQYIKCHIFTLITKAGVIFITCIFFHILYRIVLNSLSLSLYYIRVQIKLRKPGYPS